MSCTLGFATQRVWSALSDRPSAAPNGCVADTGAWSSRQPAKPKIGNKYFYRAHILQNEIRCVVGFREETLK